VPRSILPLVLALLVFAAGGGRPAAGAPQAELWPRWQAHDPQSRATIDHAAWARFLERHLVEGDDGINRVTYAAVGARDRALLQRYLAHLAAVPISDFNRDQQMAYWINLYNALTVEVVLAHYPVASIREIDISPGLFSDGPWGAELITIEGEALSLDDIEHRILRPIWRDPRIHYAVNCAALGCPELRFEPYQGAIIDRQLDAAAGDYVNHPRGVTIEDGELVVSSIYVWFQDDFGASEAAVIEHLRRHAGAGLAAELERFASIDDHRYDWSLNDARRAGGTG